MEHSGITKILGYGCEGKIVKPSGRLISNLVYIMLEYVPRGVFFDLIEQTGGLGEQGGRYFMNQLTDVLAYLSSKKVAHRDLKLDNIMVDENLNLKVADFGFATYRKIGALNTYTGTKTYMAPEIKEFKVYDGRKTDMFSAGVILFIMVQGIFPFNEAIKEDYYWNLLASGQTDRYWHKTGGQGLSENFKDLILKMINPDPVKRPTVDELRNHPWMQEPIDIKQTRDAILAKLKDNKFEKTTADSESIEHNTSMI